MKHKFIKADFFIQVTLLVLMILSYAVGLFTDPINYLRFLPLWLIHIFFLSPYQFLVSNSIHCFIRRSSLNSSQKVIRLIRLFILVLTYGGYFCAFLLKFIESLIIDQPPWLWLKDLLNNGLTFGCISVGSYKVEAELCMWNLYYISIPLSVIYFLLTWKEFSKSNNSTAN